MKTARIHLSLRARNGFGFWLLLYMRIDQRFFIREHSASKDSRQKRVGWNAAFISMFKNMLSIAELFISSRKEGKTFVGVDEKEERTVEVDFDFLHFCIRRRCGACGQRRCFNAFFVHFKICLLIDCP